MGTTVTGTSSTQGAALLIVLYVACNILPTYILLLSADLGTPFNGRLNQRMMLSISN